MQTIMARLAPTFLLLGLVAGSGSVVHAENGRADLGQQPEIHADTSPVNPGRNFDACWETCHHPSTRYNWQAADCRIADDMVLGGMRHCVFAAGTRNMGAVAECGFRMGMVLASSSYNAAVIGCGRCLETCTMDYVQDVARQELESGSFSCGTFSDGGVENNADNTDQRFPPSIHQTRACPSTYSCCQNPALFTFYGHTAYCLRRRWNAAGLVCAPPLSNDDPAGEAHARRSTGIHSDH